MATWAVLSSFAFHAAAHGPPAAVIGVAAKDATGIRVVALTEGFAIRLDSGWRWVCPGEFGLDGEFGLELAPPALSLDGQRTFVVGQSDLFVLESDGSVVPEHRPDLSRQSVLQLVAVGGRLFVLRLLTGGTRDIVPLDAADAGSIWHDTVPYDSLSADGDALWVARVEGAKGHAIRLARDGTVEESRTFSVQQGDRIVRVERIAGTLYVTAVTALSGGTLRRVDDADAGAEDVVVLSSDAPIAGPVPAGAASAWAMSDATLQAITSGVATAYPTSYPVTCLGTFGDAEYLCAQTRLLALDSTGPENELFNLSAIQGPEPESLSADCKAQWDVFRYDLGRAGVTLPRNDPDGGSVVPVLHPVSSGCAIATKTDGSPASGLALAVALALYVRASLRRRGTRLGRTGATRSSSTSRRTSPPRT